MPVKNQSKYDSEKNFKIVKDTKKPAQDKPKTKTGTPDKRR